MIEHDRGGDEGGMPPELASEPITGKVREVVAVRRRRRTSRVHGRLDWVPHNARRLSRRVLGLSALVMLVMAGIMYVILSRSDSAEKSRQSIMVSVGRTSA